MSLSERQTLTDLSGDQERDDAFIVHLVAMMLQVQASANLIHFPNFSKNRKKKVPLFFEASVPKNTYC
jgi:hypothetical protein